MKTLVSLLAVAVALSACGGGGGNQTSGSDVSILDSFISRVITLVSNSDDTAEPVAVDATTATTPENSEPVPVS